MHHTFEELLEIENLLLDAEQFLELPEDERQSLDDRRSKLVARLKNYAELPGCQTIARELGIEVEPSDHSDADKASPVAASATVQEPSLNFSAQDRVGLAFSGGGIRSATFNLGLLKGLADLDVLRHIDYVSTVSGGGYIAAWWTTWRTRLKQRNVAPLPEFPKGSVPRTIKSELGPPEVRHLRRFSNFLVPRFGFFRIDFWNGVVAWLCGLMPAALIAASVLSAAIWVWLGAAWLLLGRDAMWSSATLTLATAAVLVLTEIWWQFPRIHIAVTQWRYLLLGAASLSILLILSTPAVGSRLPVIFQLESAQLRRNFEDSITAQFHPQIVAPTLLLLCAAAVIILGRFLTYGIRLLIIDRIPASQPTGPWEIVARRVLDRLVVLALLWLAFAALWGAALQLDRNLSTVIAGSGAGAFGFAALQKWFSQAFRPAKQVGLSKKLLPILPQLLAYSVVILALLALCILVQRTVDRGVWIWIWPVSCATLLVLAYGLFDPIHIGLHAFYRDRLCRAYLGASNRPADLGLKVEPQQHDDLTLCSTRLRPLHLICCASNELDADPLVNLARGARSAVLSRIGMSIGNAWSSCPEVTVSSAITASASAINPGMGSISIHLGPAVAFLMCALGLRLGLWAPRGGAPPIGRWPTAPGRLFFKEMFSLSDRREVHLSDGGHFENLGLYELVRRHCRYIIVSDCGADPSVAFDDLANVMRLVREDFGVEIELDVTPLRPDEAGYAKQHMAVGTIHYDHGHLDRNDKGILLYFKPNLTGDEPSDIQQYNTRNKTFPNESTADQFYDEAQWESYRRLGEHAARASLRFLQRDGAVGAPRDRIFTKARWEWYPTPPELTDRFVHFTARFAELENRLQNAPAAFQTEVFPELQFLAKNDNPTMAAAEVRSALSLLIQMLQLMEDVYVGCSFEETWSHPLNAGWINLFARWTRGRTFRLWWPLLQSLYGYRFRRFLHDRFAVDEQGEWILTGPTAHQIPDGLAAKWWALEGGKSVLDANQAVYEYTLATHNAGAAEVTWQMAFAKITRQPDEHGATANWRADEFFVPPSMWGTGIGTRFLTDLLQHLKRGGVTLCEVSLGSTGAINGPGKRAAHTDTITFYKSAGFEETLEGALQRKL